MKNVPNPLLASWFFLIVLYCVTFGALPFFLGPFDFNHLSTYYEIAWRFWTESPGLPHFNPYFCGGRTLGADPQIPVFHPVVFLIGLFGPVWTLKWEMLAQLVLGLWGLDRWLKRWETSEAGRIWGLLLFAGGGFTVAHYMVGHVTLGFYTLLPLYFLLSYRLCDRRIINQFSNGAAFVLLFIYCTLYKPNFLIYAVPALIFEALCRSLLSRNPRPLFLLIAGVGTGGLVSAITLLPAASYFSAFPRSFDAGIKHTPVYTLVANILLPLKAIPARWYGTAFMQRHEYSIFLGPVAVLFAYAGFRGRSRNCPERLSLLLFGLFSAWLGLGAPSQGFQLFYPFSWFDRFWPGFQSIRVPVRFWYGVFLCLTVFSSQGFQWPHTRFRQVALVFLGIAPLLLQSTINLGKVTWFASQPQWRPTRVAHSTFTQTHGTADFPYSSVRQGEGVIECVENLEAFRSPLLRAGELLNIRSEKPLSFQGKWIKWNHIHLEGHTSVKNRVALNINHHPYWQVEGTQMRLVSESTELLTLEADAGRFEADLVFRQPQLAFGMEISLFAIVMLVAWVSFSFRKSRRPWRIGLTGGIGTGKTLVAQFLRKRGWIVVDLDAEARRMTDTDPTIHQKLRAIFGPEIIVDGKLDRLAVRNQIFSQPSKRAALEELLHPLLIAVFETRYRQATRAGVRAVVCEAALLVETGHYLNFDRLIVVTAPLAIRRERIKARDKIGDAEVDAVLNAQSSDDLKLRNADFVLHNGADAAALEKEIENTIPAL